MNKDKRIVFLVPYISDNFPKSKAPIKAVICTITIAKTKDNCSSFNSRIAYVQKLQ